MPEKDTATQTHSEREREKKPWNQFPFLKIDNPSISTDWLNMISICYRMHALVVFFFAERYQFDKLGEREGEQKVKWKQQKNMFMLFNRSICVQRYFLLLLCECFYLKIYIYWHFQFGRFDSRIVKNSMWIALLRIDVTACFCIVDMTIRHIRNIDKK